MQGDLFYYSKHHLYCLLGYFTIRAAPGLSGPKNTCDAKIGEKKHVKHKIFQFESII